MTTQVHDRLGDGVAIPFHSLQNEKQVGKCKCCCRSSMLLNPQACVRERAMKSVLCVRDVSEREAREVVDRVFQTCFADTDPFERVPP